MHCHTVVMHSGTLNTNARNTRLHVISAVVLARMTTRITTLLVHRLLLLLVHLVLALLVHLVLTHPLLLHHLSISFIRVHLVLMLQIIEVIVLRQMIELRVQCSLPRRSPRRDVVWIAKSALVSLRRYHL